MSIDSHDDLVALQRVGRLVAAALAAMEAAAMPGMTTADLDAVGADLLRKSGARSAEALAVLHKAGFADAVHVGGGVLAWVKQVDPSLPSY